MKFYALVLAFVALCLVSEQFVSASSAFDYVYRFVDAKATSTNPGKNLDEFSALRAVQPAMGYWCSEGNHDPDTVVSWIGTLNSKTTLSGLQIRWAFSPKEVKILVSSDGITERTALDWRATPSNEQSFDETLYFTKPELAETVKISMRGIKKSYYGITMVTPISPTKPLVLIVSGITSPAGEMCLQVSNGDMHVENAAVVLDYCAAAIAAGDGRELWRMNNKNQLQSVVSTPPKCLVLEGMNTTAGGNVVIADCMGSLSTGDARSYWNFVPYGQIVLQARNESFCLSQRGSSAGFVNVLRIKGAKATASSNSDKAHEPSKGIDGNMRTWWGSGAFSDAGEHRVIYDIDIGAVSKINKVRVDWEYPPFQYTIMVSTDATDWVEVAGSKANPANTTLDGVSSKVAQYVRLSLERPHPRYGRLKTKFLYGIRDVQVLVNKLETIVEDRYKAGNAKDARDKYFLVPVREFDPVLSNTLTTMEDELQTRIYGIQTAESEAEELIPKIQNCASVMETYDKKLSEAEKNIVATKLRFENGTAGDLGVASVQLAAGLFLGDTKALAAEDCYVIKMRNPLAQSGFYWLAPRCSSHPFRAWCDMQTGSMIYVWNGNPPKKPNTSILSLVNSVESIRLHCAQVGLEPIVLKNKDQLKSITTTLIKMGFDLSANRAIPLGYDPHSSTGKSTGTYRDFTLGNDITSILMGSATPDNVKKGLSGFNAAGLGLGDRSVTFFDLGVTDIAAIICSTNTLLSDQATQHVSIDCDTVASHNPLFSGASDTNILVQCPAGCEEDTTLSVYGGSGVYHDASSICRAAIHAGITQHGGTVNVALEGPRDTYEGSFQNGVQSRAVTNDDGSRTIRLGPVPKDCPIDLLDESSVTPLSASFLQLTTHYKSSALDIKKLDTSSADKRNDTSALVQTSFMQLGIPLSEPNVPEEVNEFLFKMYDMIDETHGVDPHLVLMTQQQTADTLSRTRGALKPAEILELQQEQKAIDVFELTQDVAEGFYQTLGEAFSTLHDVMEQLQRLSRSRTQSRGYSSWALNVVDSSFESSWDAFVSSGVVGKGDWRYAPAPASLASPPGGLVSKGSLLQQGFVSREPGAYGMGAFATLKDRRFFDFIYALKFYVDGSLDAQTPVLGAAFRVRDGQNMYLLELDRSTKPGTKRLLRIHQGVVHIMCERQDGGYIPSTWYNIHIETSHGRLRVCVAEEGKPLDTIFDLQDEYFLSGSVGVFTSETGPMAPVQFSFLSVKAKPCKSLRCGDLHPPAPAECSVLRDTYFTQLRSFYSISDASNTKGGPSKWDYVRDIDGRSRVLRQQNPISSTDVENPPATVAIVKGYHTCPHGLFTFQFYCPCPDGSVGALFRYRSNDAYYIVEVSPLYVIRLRLKMGLHFLTVTPFQESKGPKISNEMQPQWMTLAIAFNGPMVKVRLTPVSSNEKVLSGQAGSEVLYRVDPLLVPTAYESQASGAFRIGVSTTGCQGVLFDRLQMGPMDLMYITHFVRDDSNVDNAVSKPFLSSSWPKCITSQSFLERQNLCASLYPSNGNAMGHCVTEFCSSCCSYYTGMLRSTRDRRLCEARCSVNNDFSQKTKRAWLNSLSECVGRFNEYPETPLCSSQEIRRNDTNGTSRCHHEACLTCCSTHSAFDVFEQRPNASIYHRDVVINTRPAMPLTTIPLNDTDTFLQRFPLEAHHCRATCVKKYFGIYKNMHEQAVAV